MIRAAGLRGAFEGKVGLCLLPVRQAYDRWSAVYDVYDNPMVSAAKDVVTGVAPMAQGRHVLELGCGTGRNLVVLSGAGAASVTALAISRLQERRRPPEDPAR